MKLSALLSPLLDAKADHELIRQQILAFESEQKDALEQRRASDAARQAKRREKEKSRDITLRHSDRHLARAADARAEDKTLTTVIEPQGKKERSSTDERAFRDELANDLDQVRLDALVKHRRAKKASLTAHAAKLFRRDAAACGLSLPDATDTCISRNWITVKAEWLVDRRQQAPPPTNPIRDVISNLRNEIREGASDGRTSEIGPDRPPHVRLLAGGRSGE